MLRRPEAMEVTCERCGAHYDLDETLVGPTGTPVLCTSCGHRFRVPARLAELDPEDSVIWRVRRGTDGRVRELRSLQELKGAIRSGEIRRDDEISRGGQPWKVIGEIPELGPTFREAEGTEPSGAERPGPSSGSGTRADGDRGEVDATTTLRDPRPNDGDAPAEGGSRPPESAPPGARRRGPRLVPTPEGALRDPTGSSSPTGRDHPPEAARGASRTPGPRRYTRPDWDPPATPSPWTAGRPGPRTTVGGRPGGSRGRPSLQSWTLLLGTLAVLGLTAWAQWDRIAPRLGLGEPADPVAPFLARAEEALARGTRADFAAALRETTRATALSEQDARVLATASRAQARWAQTLRFDRWDRRAQRERAQAEETSSRDGADPGPGVDDPKLDARLEALEDEIRSLVTEARRQAEDAVRIAPEEPMARLALADTMRLEGDLEGSRAQLRRALAARPVHPETGAEDDGAGDGRAIPLAAERHRLESLLEAGAEGEAAPGLAAAHRAVAAAPDDLGLAVLLARALLGAAQVPEARRVLRGVLDRRPGHGRARRLLDAIDAGRPPAPPTVAVLEVDDTDLGPSALLGDDGTGEALPLQGAEALGGVGDPPPGAGYDWFLRAGDEALDRGDPASARRLFEAALEQRPGGREALAGLGWVDFELGDTDGARRRFQAAANAGLPDAWLGLAEVAGSRGNDRDALDALERYVAAVPSGRQAEAARREMVVLRGRLAAAGSPTQGTGDADDDERDPSAAAGGGGTDGAAGVPPGPRDEGVDDGVDGDALETAEEGPS